MRPVTMNKLTFARVDWDDELAEHVLRYTKDGQELTKIIDADEPKEVFRKAAKFLGLGPVKCPQCGKIEVFVDSGDALYACCPCTKAAQILGWGLLQLPTLR